MVQGTFEHSLHDQTGRATVIADAERDHLDNAVVTQRKVRARLSPDVSAAQQETNA